MNRPAIAYICAKFVDPVGLPQMGRKQFDGFLRDVFGRPDDDAWKRPFTTETLEGDADFSIIEHFETPVGPLVAAHTHDDANVHVVLNRPINHSHATAQDILDYAMTVANA